MFGRLTLGDDANPYSVMPGLVPGIHDDEAIRSPADKSMPPSNIPTTLK